MLQSSTLNTRTNNSTPIFFDSSEPYETNSGVFFLKIPFEDSVYTNTDIYKTFASLCKRSIN